MEHARMLVLSIDAMTGDDLRAAASLPNFARLLDGCALATDVLSVFPSLTYPCHVTMATGCWPMHTGVCNNERFLPETRKRPWYFYTDELARPTIFAAARAAGVSTGCVMWPCMGRGPIDTLVPEIWGKTPDAPFLEPFCAAGSADFIREIWPRVGGIPQGFRQPMFDTFVAAIAEEVIRRRAPRLLYVHICQVDNAKHCFGLGSAQVQTALCNTDRLLGRLLRALEETGVLAQTDIALCADHGQRPVTRVSFPNRFLRARGLLTPTEGGVSAWRAQAHSACLSALLYENGAKNAGAALRLLEDEGARRALGIAEVVPRAQAAARYHLDGGFAAALLGEEGVFFSDDMDDGPLLAPAAQTNVRYLANHGHDPAVGEKPFFLLHGPHARCGARLRGARLVDEAPTVAAVMGLEMPWADGRALRELLR